MQTRSDHNVRLEDIMAMDLPELPPRPADSKNDPLYFLKQMGYGTPGGPPLPHAPTPAEVREQAFSRASAIFASVQRLQHILDRHQSTVQMRWLKKTQTQKQKVLLEAWGDDLPSQHRELCYLLLYRRNRLTILWVPPLKHSAKELSSSARAEPATELLISMPTSTEKT